MTAKAVKALVRMPPFGGIALLCLLPIAAVARDGPYLTWGAKNAPIQQAGAATQIPVPPSPYGQVGDPYLHVLSWGAKSGNAQPSRPNPSPPMARPQPAPAQRIAEPVQAYVPAPQAPAYHPAPQYSAQPVAPARPQPAPSQAVASQAVPSQAVLDQAPAVRQPPLAAQSQLRAPAKTPAPAPAATPDDGAYQVPANSPYAARIAAARAAQARAEAKATKPAAAHTSQAAQDQAAVTETPADDDKPFVPGEHYTDASEAPRLYSLHRGYGLKPDPITVDSNASGAVLDTSHLDAAEARAAKDDKTSAADKDEDDDAGTDSVPANPNVSKSNTAKPNTSSASGTQNASTGKTEKTAQ